MPRLSSYAAASLTLGCGEISSRAYIFLGTYFAVAKYVTRRGHDVWPQPTTHVAATK